MVTNIPRPFKAQLIDHLVAEYFNGDMDKFCERIGYPKRQVLSWQTGKRNPQIAAVRWMLSATVAPEFRVACEFAPINITDDTKISEQLKEALQGHMGSSGVYAFYDSMCNVVYIGKASTSFLKEMYQQLRAGLDIKFGKAVPRAPTKRWQVIRYVSAYEIPAVEHLDYPKHVESLVLRLSKPIGNKVLGKLQISAPPLTN